MCFAAETPCQLRLSYLRCGWCRAIRDFKHEEIAYDTSHRRACRSCRRRRRRRRSRHFRFGAGLVLVLDRSAGRSVRLFELRVRALLRTGPVRILRTSGGLPALLSAVLPPLLPAVRLLPALVRR